MKLLNLRDNVFYIHGLINIGVVTNGCGAALLVDAGLDEGFARRIKALLDASRLTIKGIVVTHAHADHFGGANYLSRESGARIYSSQLEKGVCEAPILEAAGLFGSAYPPLELRRKYFNAPRVEIYETVLPGETEIEGFPLEVVDLSGHTLGQIGISINDVLFCADAIANSRQIDKQGILKQANIDFAIKTYKRLQSRKECIFVPSHGAPLTDIRLLIAENQEAVNDVLTLVYRLAREPIGVEDLLAGICTEKAVTIRNLSHYYVLHLSILAYLGYLLDRNRLTVIYRGNKQLVSAINSTVSP